MRNINSVGSVSYTHLDVYKRQLQWCLDAKVPCILCHHSTNEMEGMAGMVHYLSKVFPDCRFVKLDEGFQFTLVEASAED